MSSEKQFEFTKENIDNVNQLAEELQKKSSRASILAELRERKNGDKE